MVDIKNVDNNNSFSSEVNDALEKTQKQLKIFKDWLDRTRKEGATNIQQNQWYLDDITKNLMIIEKGLKEGLKKVSMNNEIFGQVNDKLKDVVVTALRETKNSKEVQEQVAPYQTILLSVLGNVDKGIIAIERYARECRDESNRVQRKEKPQL